MEPILSSYSSQPDFIGSIVNALTKALPASKALSLIFINVSNANISNALKETFIPSIPLDIGEKSTLDTDFSRLSNPAEAPSRFFIPFSKFNKVDNEVFIFDSNDLLSNVISSIRLSTDLPIHYLLPRFIC